MKMPFVPHALCALIGVANASAAPAINQEPVMMAPFEVVAHTVEFKAWSKYQTEHFVLYTDAGDKHARQVLRHLEMERAVQVAFFQRRALHLSPIVLIMPGDDSDWNRVSRQIDPAWNIGTVVHSSGPARLVIVRYNWETRGLSAVNTFVAETLLRDINLSGPLWFTVGVGSFFSTIEVDGNRVTLGRPDSWPSALQKAGWLPWPVLFTKGRSSDDPRGQRYFIQFGSQSAAFVQYLLSREDASHVQRLIKWSDLTNTGRPPSEADFKDVFGQDWESWQQTISNYARAGRYQSVHYELPPGKAEFAVEKQDLPTQEMRELFVLAQIMNRRGPASEASLEALLNRGLEAKALTELLANACYTYKRDEDALSTLRKLIAADSKNPAVYDCAAWTLFQRHRRGSPINVNLGEDAAEIEAWCRRALALEPAYPSANSLLAWTLALSAHPTAAQTDEIAEIYRKMKSEVPTSSVLAALATAYVRRGDAPAARYLCETILKSKDALRSDREIAETFLPAKSAPAKP